MKKYLLLSLVAVGLSVAVNAQSEKYMNAMKSNLALFDSSKTVEDFNKLANNFERIGDAEKTQWLPYYYAALALSSSGWMPDLKDKDANATRMNAFLDKADAVATSNADKAEILAVRNMSATQQMLVDPQARWATYGKTSAEALEKGMQLDPNNPRLYYLKGMSLFGTPAAFGGGKDKAKPLFEKSVALYKEAKPGQFAPHWGQKQAEDMLAQSN